MEGRPIRTILLLLIYNRTNNGKEVCGWLQWQWHEKKRKNWKQNVEIRWQVSHQLFSKIWKQSYFFPVCDRVLFFLFYQSISAFSN